MEGWMDGGSGSFTHPAERRAGRVCAHWEACSSPFSLSLSLSLRVSPSPPLSLLLLLLLLLYFPQLFQHCGGIGSCVRGNRRVWLKGGATGVRVRGFSRVCARVCVCARLCVYACVCVREGRGGGGYSDVGWGDGGGENGRAHKDSVARERAHIVTAEHGATLINEHDTPQTRSPAPFTQQHD